MGSPNPGFDRKETYVNGDRLTDEHFHDKGSKIKKDKMALTMPALRDG